MKNNKKTILTAVLVLTALILGGIGGYCLGNSKEAPVTAQDRTLRIQVTAAPDADPTVYSCADLEGSFNQDIQFDGVTDVTIQIGENTMLLIDALRQGLITDEEIFLFARMDAARGICQESSASVRGVTNFTYTYPEFDLRIVYDLYETPDGQQHLISDMGIYLPNSEEGPYVPFINPATDDWYDREDWGLEFQVASVSSEGMTLNCHHSGGQQIGTLQTRYYAIRNNKGYLPQLDGDYSGPSHHQILNLNSETQLTLEWADQFGQLTSGRYVLELHVEDIYDESMVHPLMVNYHDLQCWVIEFEIP